MCFFTLNMYSLCCYCGVIFCGSSIEATLVFKPPLNFLTVVNGNSIYGQQKSGLIVEVDH